jgi:uncharacterized protein YbaP (TraB family)
MAILKRGLMSQVPALVALALFALPTWSKPLPLWELQSSGSRVLLMGSVHFLRASDYPLRQGLDEAYRLADTITMEIDMSAVDQLATQGSIAALSIDPQGRSLRELIGDDSYQNATRLAEQLGIPLMMFEQFEPWFAALSITQLRMIQLGFDPAWGIETMLTRKALAENKTLDGLETIEEQLSFMDQLDPDEQNTFLLQSLEDASTVQNDIDAIVDAWTDGDAAELERFLLKELRDVPKLYDAILVQRNKNWLGPIRALLDEPGTHLVVVGAMHLIGDDSVLTLLDEVGIASRQLSDKDF